MDNRHLTTLLQRFLSIHVATNSSKLVKQKSQTRLKIQNGGAVGPPFIAYYIYIKYIYLL
jgi:hypothetical protein